MASTAYISASTNRFSGVADVSGSLVAFGSGRFVALWGAAETEGKRVQHTAPGHQSHVTCVRFLSDSHFISADDKGCVKLWRKDVKWECPASITAHEGPVSTITYRDDVLFTGGSDGVVKIWRIMVNASNEDVFQQVQILPLRGKLPMTVAISTLPQSEAFILVIGGTDGKLDIWTGRPGQLAHALSLAGHDDWIRALAFKPHEPEDQSRTLASGSGDSTIRLWSIDISTTSKTSTSKTSDVLSDEMLESFEASFKDSVDGEDSGGRMSLQRHRITTTDLSGGTLLHQITFDALLVGHEAGVTSLAWIPKVASDSAVSLLSTSTDSSVILWGQTSINVHEKTTFLWTNHQRFGDVGGQRLGGFVGGIWTENGSGVLAWGWSGGCRRWRLSGNQWREVGAITGHNAPVRGLAWSPGGEYLLSTGLDQTTRIHAEVKSEDAIRAWQEVARPQVHGYDLISGVFLDALRCATVADEKVVRVFDAPQPFVSLVDKICGIQLGEENTSRPAAASVPPLGLSNKAVADSGEETSSFLSEQRAPYEGELASATLWPEAEKIFGHGYELIAIAISNSKRILATACKATTAEHAVVRLYDTEKWHPYGDPLAGHNLTITRMAFSPDDLYLLSVSRDRTWRLFSAKDNGYQPIAADKSHGRVIWDCAWAWEGHTFATASRDKMVSIWQVPANDLPQKWTPVATLKLDDAATAVAFHPANANGRRFLAVGLESGHIHVFRSEVASPAEWIQLTHIDSSIAHVDHIYQLQWRPQKGIGAQLASCSEDGTLRILNVQTEMT